MSSKSKPSAVKTDSPSCDDVAWTVDEVSKATGLSTKDIRSFLRIGKRELVTPHSVIVCLERVNLLMSQYV